MKAVVSQGLNGKANRIYYITITQSRTVFQEFITQANKLIITKGCYF